MPKICAYVQRRYAKASYKNECFDARLFVGLRVVIDVLERAGFSVEYAGMDTVHEYDIVLVSIPSQIDWFSFVRERLRWKPGRYKVAIGGAGVLNVEPFLAYFDAAMLGRGEDLIVPVVEALLSGTKCNSKSVVFADEFTPDMDREIAQAGENYVHAISVSEKREWRETQIGCNHRCLFCSYTWSRRQNFRGAFRWDEIRGDGIGEKECALLDYASGARPVDFRHIRTTAIDGSSERLRFMVGKRIRNEVLIRFLRDAAASAETPHLIRLFNIVGLPSETEDDWRDLLATVAAADRGATKRDDGKKWLIALQNNPFLPYPATPMACAPMEMCDFREMTFARRLGIDLPKRRLYVGQSIDLIESWTVENLSTIALNALALRGTVAEADALKRLCLSSQFWGASSRVKIATLRQYFPLDRIFGAYRPETLPTRWLHTWAKVENMWRRDFK